MAAERETVIRLLTKHAPPQLERLDEIMGVWSGREEQLVKTLRDKFKDYEGMDNSGGEPPPPPTQAREHDTQRAADGGEASQAMPAPAAVATAAPGVVKKSPAEVEVLRRKLHAFYEEREPSKLGQIEVIITQLGHLPDATIFEKLEQRYPKPAPDTAAPPAAPVVVASPAQVPPSNAGAATDVARFARRLERFFAKYAPEKVPTAPSLAERLIAQEEGAMQRLVDNYGPEPPADNAAPTAAPPPAVPLPVAPTPVAPRDADDPNGDAMLRRRLVAIFERFDRDRLARVDDIMAAMAGNEEAIMRDVEKKYGLAPGGSVALVQGEVPLGKGGEGVAPASRRSYRERMTALFEKYDPTRIGDVDRFLAAAEGREEEMIEKLVSKYGPEPAPPPAVTVADAPAAASTTPAATAPATPKADRGAAALNHSASPSSPSPAATTGAEDPFADLRKRVLRMLQHYAPEKAANLDRIFASFAGQENTIIPELVKKYGPEPPAIPGAAASPASPGRAPKPRRELPLRERVMRFYQVYNPENIDSIDRIIDAFQGNEAAIIAALVKKYGPEPRTDDGLGPEDDDDGMGVGREGTEGSAMYDGAGRAPGDVALEMDPGRDGMRRRLQKFYGKHAPEKMGTLEQIIDAWHDREEELWAALYDKYSIPESERFRIAGPTAPTDYAGGVPSDALRASRSLAAMAGVPTASEKPPGVLKGPNEPSIDGRGKLVVHVRAAADLLQSRRRRFNDGVLAVIMYPQKEVFRTGTSAHESAPTWSEREGQTMITLQQDDRTLTIRVMDADQNFLGEALLRFDDMPFVGVHAFPLRKRPVELDPFVAEATYLGTLTVKWGFVPDFALPTVRALGGARGGRDDDAEHGGLDWRLLRLRAFFSRYLPERLGEVQSIAQQYQGREVDLLDCLCLRFGPEPDPYDFRARLERIFAHYDPTRVREAAAIAQQCEGREDFVLKSLSKKYGPEPGAGYSVPPPTVIATNSPGDRHRTRLSRWFMLIAPRRVAEVDYMLHRFAGREDVMFRLMAQTLGPEPNSDAPRENIRSTFAVTPALKAYYARRRGPPFLDWLWTGPADVDDHAASSFDPAYHRLYKRLERFYRHYNPIKVNEIEETLSRWKGREDLLFEALTHKYGAEPPEVAPSRELPAGAAAASNMTSPLNASNVSNGGPLASSLNRSADGSPGPSTHSVVGRTPRAVLQSFYASHNPGKLRDVEDLLERFLGREEQLYHLLHTKYGIDPTLLPSALSQVQIERAGPSAAQRSLGYGVASPLGHTRRLVKPPTLLADVEHDAVSTRRQPDHVTDQLDGYNRRSSRREHQDDAADLASDFSRV
jgi:hypothetical protein